MTTPREFAAEPATDDAVALQVVGVVADALGESPGNLEPLHRSIDTDALDGLYAGESGPRVEFRTNGCRVVVDEDGRVVARPVED